jgi:hypothetical protein
MAKQNKKSPAAKTNDKSKIEVIIQSSTCKLRNRKKEDCKQFIKIDQYGELIDILTGFPGGENYFVKPILLYLDEEEIEDSYYIEARERYDLTKHECYIRGLEIIASCFSPGYVGMLREYDFVVTNADSNSYGVRLIFEHTVFNER